MYDYTLSCVVEILGGTFRRHGATMGGATPSPAWSLEYGKLRLAHLAEQRKLLRRWKT